MIGKIKENVLEVNTAESVNVPQKVYMCYRKCICATDSVYVLQKVYMCYRKCKCATESVNVPQKAIMISTSSKEYDLVL